MDLRPEEGVKMRSAQHIQTKEHKSKPDHGNNMNNSRSERTYSKSEPDFDYYVAKKYNSKIINRPKNLCMPDSLTEDVLVHAYKEIGKVIDIKKIKSIALLFCNNPAIDVLKLKVPFSL